MTGRAALATPALYPASSFVPRKSLIEQRQRLLNGADGIEQTAAYVHRELRQILCHDADGKIGKSTYTSAASIGGSWAGGALGAKGGALAGAAIGTAILPGIGTAIGGIAGGLILGVAGSYAGSSLGKWVIDITEIGE